MYTTQPVPSCASPDTQTTPYSKDTVVNGRSGRIECIDIGRQTFAIDRGVVSVARLEDEWYDDIDDPHAIVRALSLNHAAGVDLFTFWQRLPDVAPRYEFHREWEHIAVLAVSSYENWWTNQIKSRVRSQIRKAQKEGLAVRETGFDDAFVAGMTAVFNETAVRQGRAFWHYGKDFETVKAQFSRFVHREHMIGAYVDGEMIGFMMLGNAGRFALTGQIISSVRHRDKTPNNALIAKAVEMCAARGLPYLVYFFWGDDTLSEFKRRCGFEAAPIPRYYVPLTWKGRLALKIGVHRGLRACVPAVVKKPLKDLRSRWYALRAR